VAVHFGDGGEFVCQHAQVTALLVVAVEQVAIQVGSELFMVGLRVVEAGFDNGAQLFQGAFPQDIKGAPRGFIGRGFGFPQPVAIGVDKQVILGANRGVHAR